MLVVVIIANDVGRCGLSRRNWWWRPYYTVEDGKLKIHNEPVPRGPPPPLLDSSFRNLLRYSDLADTVLRRLAPAWWYPNQGNIRVHRDGVNVAILLMDRLASLQRQSGVPVLFVLEQADEGQMPQIRPVISRALAQGLQVLDLSEPLGKLIQQTDGTPDAFAAGHLTPRGNRWVADRIIEKLHQMGVLAVRHTAQYRTKAVNSTSSITSPLLLLSDPMWRG
jgi:hypothetical protein